eukprot:1066562-Rhodomonas_salina.1
MTTSCRLSSAIASNRHENFPNGGIALYTHPWYQSSRIREFSAPRTSASDTAQHCTLDRYRTSLATILGAWPYLDCSEIHVVQSGEHVTLAARFDGGGDERGPNARVTVEEITCDGVALRPTYATSVTDFA